MASLSSDGPGRYRILFVAPDKARKTVRLGKVPKKMAESVRVRVEALVAAVTAKMPLDADTAAWVAGIGDDLAAKLAAVGLIPGRRSQTLGAFLADYLDRRRADSKPATVTHLTTVRNDLTAFYGADTPLRDITEQRADDFRTHYLTRGPKLLAPGTVFRRLKAVKMLFKHAHRVKLVPANPFADVTAPGGVDEARKFYLPAGDAHKLIAAANPVWRVIVALCRFGGLRCPSEVLTLKWADVNFETGRMTVGSPKTEHLPGKAYRVVPIFPELRPVLDEAWELAGEGELYVVGGLQGDRYRAAAHGPNGWVNCNLRETFLKLIRRAGLKPWPRVFHNLRASCETDLMQSFPIHVVCAWLGNTPAIALRHYLQVTDADFERAVTGGAHSGTRPAQNAAQSAAGQNGRQMTGKPEPDAGVRVSPSMTIEDMLGQVVLMGEAGLEPPTEYPGQTSDSVIPDLDARADSGTLAAGLTPDVLLLASRLAALTSDQRAALTALLAPPPSEPVPKVP